MRVRKNIRNFLAVFLALAVTGSAFWSDVHVSRAEECGLEVPDAYDEEEADVSDEQAEGTDEEPGEALEVSEEEPKEEPEEVLEMPEEDPAPEPEEEPVPELMLLNVSEEGSIMLTAASDETVYPVYIPASTVTFLEQPDYNVLYIGGVMGDEVGASVGETVSSQHRSMLTIRCSRCSNKIYTLLPLVYSDVVVTYSDESLIGEHGYGAGRWTQDDQAEGSGCMQLNTKVVRPGTVDVEILYNIRFTTFYNAQGKCPLCSEWMVQSNNNKQWYRYRNAYEIKVYADYTINYDANAGSEYVADLPAPTTEKICAESGRLPITSGTPSRAGYDFVGWAEKKDAVFGEYQPGDEIWLDWTEGRTVEKTLYAVWQRVIPGITPEEPAEEEPDLTFIKKACGPDTVTPITSVEVGEAYSYVVTVRNNMEHAIENLRVSEVLDADLIQLLENPPDYENEIWKIDRLEPQETAVLILHVKALAECPEYENTIHLMVIGSDGTEKEILPGPDDQPTAVVEIRAASDPPPEEPDDPDPGPGSRTDPSPDPTPDPEPVGDPTPPVPVPIPAIVRPPVPEEQTEPFYERPNLTTERPVKRTEPSAETPVKTQDPQPPLAGNGRHLCCILHFVIMLLAWIVEWFYMRSMKKHQSRIFELRRELADAET